MSTPPDLNVSTILTRWPVSATDVCPIQLTGFSGARLWKINPRTPQPLGLKHYAGSALTVAQLDGIHRVLIHAFNEGCDFIAKPLRLKDGFTSVVAVPSGSPTAGLWDLSNWVPGNALSAFGNAQIASAFASIARFHQAAAQVNLAFGPSPNLAFRQQQLMKLVRPDSDTLDRASAKLRTGSVNEMLRGNLYAIIELLKTIPQSYIASLQNGLDQFAAEDLPIHPVVRDLRAEHLLFTGDRLTGLVDFDAMQMDSIAYDLARLTSSMQLNEDQLQCALTTYHAIRPIQPSEATLTQVLASVSKLLSPLAWVEWIILEDRAFPDTTNVNQRLTEVVQDLQQFGIGENQHG